MQSEQAQPIERDPTERDPVWLVREGETNYEELGGVVVVPERTPEQAAAAADAAPGEPLSLVAVGLIGLALVVIGGGVFAVRAVRIARTTDSERAFKGLCRYWGIRRRDRRPLRRLAEAAAVEPSVVVMSRDTLMASLDRARARRGEASEPVLNEALRAAQPIRAVTPTSAVPTPTS